MNARRKTNVALVPPTPRPDAPGGEADQQPVQRSTSRHRRDFLLELVMPLAFGIIGTILFYSFVVWWLPESVEERLTRGFIPRLCTWLLLWHLGTMALRFFMHIRPEMNAFGEHLLPADGSMLRPEDVEAIALRTREVESRRGRLMLTRRLALAAAHLGVRFDGAELGEILRRRAEADRLRAANAYAIPKFLVWAIPILGFVGTVLGIGLAVMNLKNTLAGLVDFQGLMAQLGKVSENLGLAFDTTLVALLMSIVAMLVQTIVRQQESRLLTSIDDYLTYRLQSRVTSSVEDRQDEMIAQLKALPDAMAERMQTGRDENLAAVLEAGLTKVAESTAAAMSEAARDAARELQQARDELVGDIGRQGREVLSGAADEFRGAVEPLQRPLEDMVTRLEAIVRDGERLAELQTGISQNLDLINKTADLEQTLQVLREHLERISPALDRLGRPIPLRLAVGSVTMDDTPVYQDDKLTDGILDS